MSRLNKAIMRRIHDALDSSVFTIGDFELEFPDSGQALVAIRFLPTKGYSFVLIENGAQLMTREIPGEHRTTEDTTRGSFKDVLARIKPWCENVKADLRASNPVYDDLDELRKTLEKEVREHVRDPEKHFTRGEADELKAKLDEIVSKFQSLREQQAITESELKIVKDEIAELKANVSTFSKGAFFRTTGNKLINLMKRVASSEVVTEVLVSSTKGFLGLPPS